MSFITWTGPDGLWCRCECGKAPVFFLRYHDYPEERVSRVWREVECLKCGRVADIEIPKGGEAG